MAEKPVRTRFEVLEKKIEQTTTAAQKREAEAAKRAAKLAGARIDRALLPVVRAVQSAEQERDAELAGAVANQRLSAEISEDEAQQPEQTEPDQQQPEQRQPSQAQQLAQAGRQRAIQFGREKIAQAGKKIAATAAKEAAVALAPEIAVVVAVIAGVIVVALLLFAVVNMTSASDPSSDGSGPTVNLDPSNQADLAALKKTIAGGVDNAAKAQAVLDETKKVRPQLVNNAQALALLDAIDAAAKAIIAADPTDTAKITEQATVISQKIKALEAVLAPTTACAGVTCLDVEPIAEAVHTHCGRVSALMVLRYVNIGFGDQYFKQNDFIVSRNGQLTDLAQAESCLRDDILNKDSPPNRRGWRRRNWQAMAGSEKEQKDALLKIVQRSIAGRDPVIMYTIRGGIFKESKHIFVVVGYSPNDAPEQGGTYIINNPNVGYTTPKTDKNATGQKLTGNWLAQYLGGDGRDGYQTSIVVRDAYANQ